MAVQSTTAALSAKGFMLGPSDYRYIPPQFAYESDGTKYTGRLNYKGSPQYDKDVTQAEFLGMNTFNGTNFYTGLGYTSQNMTWTHTFLFPEARDITHTSFYNNNVTNWYYDGFNWPGDPHFTMYYSKDAANGVGTWTQKTVVTNEYVGTAMKDRRNKAPDPVNGLTGVWAVRVFGNYGYNYNMGATCGYQHYIHFHGTKSNDQRLAFWKADVDEEVDMGYFDWGTYPQGTSYKYFRVKNLGTQTAQGNVLTIDAPEHSLAIGAGTYGTSISVPALAGGEVSAVITLKRDSPGLYPLTPIPFQRNWHLTVTPTRWAG